MAQDKLYPMMVASNSQIYVVFGNDTTGTVICSRPCPDGWDSSDLLEAVTGVVCASVLQWNSDWVPVAGSADVWARTYNEV